MGGPSLLVDWQTDGNIALQYLSQIHLGDHDFLS